MEQSFLPKSIQQWSQLFSKKGFCQPQSEGILVNSLTENCLHFVLTLFPLSCLLFLISMFMFRVIYLPALDISTIFCT